MQNKSSLQRVADPESAARVLEAHLGGIRLTALGGQRGIGTIAVFASEQGVLLTPKEQKEPPAKNELVGQGY